MRWVVPAIRVVFVLVLLLAPMIAPQMAVWQVVAGTAYVIGVMRLIAEFFDDPDIVDLALYGLPGPSDNPLTLRILLSRAFVVFIFWFLVIALGLVLLPVPLVPWPVHRAVSLWYFLAGTFIGAVLYLAAAGWYRNSMRRRYGY